MNTALKTLSITPEMEGKAWARFASARTCKLIFPLALARNLYAKQSIPVYFGLDADGRKFLIVSMDGGKE